VGDERRTFMKRAAREAQTDEFPEKGIVQGCNCLLKNSLKKTSYFRFPGCLLGLLFHSEDEGSIFLQKLVNLY
jgi:hypothetical protein